MKEKESMKYGVWSIKYGIGLLRHARNLSILFFVLASFLIPYSLFLTPLPAEAAWYDTTYDYCRELTMTAGGNTNGVATTTTLGFALVATSTISTLKTTGNGGNIQSTGSVSGTTTPTDVIITNGTECNSDGGSTILDFYFEKYVETTGEFVLWVESADISSTSAKTVLMYYGKSGASDQEDESGVFGASGELGVWNLHEDPTAAGASGILDSTSNNLDGTDNGTMDTTDQMNGMVDGSLDIDGNDDNIEIADPGAGSILDLGTGESVTMAAWINGDTYDVDCPTIMAKDTFNYGFQVCASGFPDFSYRNSGDTAWHEWRGNSALSTGRWYHLVTTFTYGTASSVRIYVNGVSQSGSWVVGDGTAAPLQDNTAFYIGDHANGGTEVFDGRIDDARLYDRWLHSMDVLTIYNNTRSSTLFWTFGGEETETITAAPARRFRLFEGSRIKLPSGRIILRQS